MMNKAILLVVFAFIFQALLFAGPADSLKVLTLDDCIKLAITKSTEVLKGNNNLAIAGVEVMGSYGQFLPDLTAGAGYNYTAGKDEFMSGVPLLVDGNKTGYYYQLVSSINIFNGFGDKAALKSVLLQKNGQQFSLQRVLQQISIDITQVYLQVILDRRIAAFAKDNLNTSMKREEQLKELMDVGRKVKSDLYQQQVQTSDQGIIAAQSAFEIIKGRYDLGSATFIELVNAQLNLLQAQENKTQSIIGLMLQKRIIAFYIGKS